MLRSVPSFSGGETARGSVTGSWGSGQSWCLVRALEGQNGGATCSLTQGRGWGQSISIPLTLPTSPSAPARLGDVPSKHTAPGSRGTCPPCPGVCVTCMAVLLASLHEHCSVSPHTQHQVFLYPVLSWAPCPSLPGTTGWPGTPMYPADPVPIFLMLPMLGQLLSTSPAPNMGLRCSSKDNKGS